MILTLLYHRVGDGKYANPLPMLEQHLAFVAEHAKNVVPGDILQKFRTHVCLTFDDATFDFYHLVYPLLKRFSLKAVLAIPTHFILDTTTRSAASRLTAPLKELALGPYCTWEEIREMVQSGHVVPASHSAHHINLLETLDLETEIVASKQLLEEKLHVPIKIFVYPYGKWNAPLQKKVIEHYSYAMRIGSAANFHWQEMMYRISADQLLSPDEPFRWHRKLFYALSFLLNTLRGR